MTKYAITIFISISRGHFIKYISTQATHYLQSTCSVLVIVIVIVISTAVNYLKVTLTVITTAFKNSNRTTLSKSQITLLFFTKPYPTVWTNSRAIAQCRKDRRDRPQSPRHSGGPRALPRPAARPWQRPQPHQQPVQAPQRPHTRPVCRQHHRHAQHR